MDNLPAILFAGNLHTPVSICPMPAFAKFLDTKQLADLGPGPRSGILAEKQVNEKLDEAFEAADISENARQLVRALILLWHDHLDASHTLAQGIENPDGAYVHAIMHRREPDYSNAAYWFRRVGHHRAFPELARRVSELASTAAKNQLQERFLRKGEWDPFGFVDACQQVANGEMLQDEEKCLRQIQRVEFEVLLDAIVG